MALRVRLNHKTRYRFDRPVDVAPHEIRLRPAAHCRTPIHSYSLHVRPSTHFINWQQDPFGNYLARLVFAAPTTELEFQVDLVAEMTVINPFDFFIEPYAEQFPFGYQDHLKNDLRSFLEAEPQGSVFHDWLEEFQKSDLHEDLKTTDFLVLLNQRIQRKIQYIIRYEPGIQTCDQTLEMREGSCRDSAWLVVQILRHLGLAARFVSGYLIQLKPDVPPLKGPAGPKKDFTDLHAWAETYIPGAGWVGLDATSGLLAGEGHIPLACTAYPASAAPLIGSTGPCESSFDVSMTVTRVQEDPRITKPYTERQWRQIDALGQQVDKELLAGDVRLTMGGEPTFVSIDNMEGEEWNFTALSPEKRRHAGILMKRLKERWAPGALSFQGQGKWFPGEVLPRWALGFHWRVDGKAVWRDPKWLADDTVNYGFHADHAKTFLSSLAQRLQVPTEFVLPAYEDPWHSILEEQRLPVNVDPMKHNLQDPNQRSHLARMLDQGLGKAVGYVLPIKAQSTSKARRFLKWVSCPWPFRGPHLLLIPGDSSLGWRLPLDSLIWVVPEDRELDAERDPLEEREPLEDLDRTAEENEEEPSTSSRKKPKKPKSRKSPKKIIHTALGVEEREGCLYVFLPPLSHLEDFLALVNAVETTAATLDMPIVVEGYPPPFDPRLRVLNITPDPGVIEVNIHPAGSWKELVSTTTSLYEEARMAHLGTEKFMLDGRHTGTGGGNHVTIGGPTPADSPILRRPDLLKSLIGYWQNHPALSYFFSGCFVGPTSQSPRVDEARHESLYELEIAFQQLSDQKEGIKKTRIPWLVDRLFRHLLVDLTGNTHRAEFCIDKLYPPDRASGRLGLVEFRAFEMPPHPRMSLVQTLMVRALIARFWKNPYQGNLIAWGTELHDRFMLPFYLAKDLSHVLLDLQRSGFPFQFEWFAPFYEFRFPRFGTVVYEGIELELRQAIEPWHVLGEDVQGGGTSRPVDSSVERIQVRVRNLRNSRYIVACNRRPLPLHSTGTGGEFVAGVRYRAWQPPSCLHPTIPVHAPLVFDIVDLSDGCSIGGCTYHVAHPGGRNYRSYPVNANEAEARRMARFERHGHTPGRMTIQPEEPSPEFPFTLDLRRKARGAIAFPTEELTVGSSPSKRDGKKTPKRSHKHPGGKK